MCRRQLWDKSKLDRQRPLLVDCTRSAYLPETGQAVHREGKVIRRSIAPAMGGERTVG